LLDSAPASAPAHSEPLREDDLDSLEIVGLEPTERANEYGEWERCYTLAVEDARTKEGNVYVHLVGGAARRCGSRHKRDQGAIGIRGENANDESWSNLARNPEVHEPDLAT
jgi:hypothetical protein